MCCQWKGLRSRNLSCCFGKRTRMLRKTERKRTRNHIVLKFVHVFADCWDCTNSLARNHRFSFSSMVDKLSMAGHPQLPPLFVNNHRAGKSCQQFKQLLVRMFVHVFSGGVSLSVFCKMFTFCSNSSCRKERFHLHEIAISHVDRARAMSSYFRSIFTGNLANCVVLFVLELVRSNAKRPRTSPSNGPPGGHDWEMQLYWVFSS